MVEGFEATPEQLRVGELAPRFIFSRSCFLISTIHATITMNASASCEP